MSVLRLCTGLLLLQALAVGADSIEPPRPLETFEGGPRSIANASVNVITGDYVDSCEDLRVPGPFPLSFSRSYCSSDSSKSSLSTAWAHNHHHKMPARLIEFDDQYNFRASYVDPCGSSVGLSAQL